MEQLRTTSGSASATVTCTAGAWTKTFDMTAVADGAITINADHSDAAGNAAIAALKDVVATTLLWSLRIQTDRTTASFSVPLSDHRRLYEAIARRDGEMAEMVSRILVADALREQVVRAGLRVDRAHHVPRADGDRRLYISEFVLRHRLDSE